MTPSMKLIPINASLSLPQHNVIEGGKSEALIGINFMLGVIIISIRK